MRIGLIAPLGTGCQTNPGAAMITAGIRWLCRQAVPDPVFVPIDAFDDSLPEWLAAGTCDALIMCGNPRFTMSPANAWWECDIWYRLAAAQAAGIRVIDGWSGAAHGHNPELTCEEMARAIFDFPRNRQYLALAGHAHARITRDAMMQRVYELAGAPSVLLPCSSWWAAKECAIEPAPVRDRNAVMLLGQPGQAWVAPAVCVALEQLSADGRRVDLVASAIGDYTELRGAGFDVQLIPDPTSLLRLYARCERVLAFRIHAAIPAAALGCAVGVVAVDSRALTCEPFGLPIIEQQEFADRLPEYALAAIPDERAVVDVLRGMLCQ